MSNFTPDDVIVFDDYYKHQEAQGSTGGGMVGPVGNLLDMNDTYEYVNETFEFPSFPEYMQVKTLRIRHLMMNHSYKKKSTHAFPYKMIKHIFTAVQIVI